MFIKNPTLHLLGTSYMWPNWNRQFLIFYTLLSKMARKVHCRLCRILFLLLFALMLTVFF